MFPHASENTFVPIRIGGGLYNARASAVCLGEVGSSKIQNARDSGSTATREMDMSGSKLRLLHEPC